VAGSKGGRQARGAASNDDDVERSRHERRPISSRASPWLVTDALRDGLGEGRGRSLGVRASERPNLLDRGEERRVHPTTPATEEEMKPQPARASGGEFAVDVVGKAGFGICARADQRAHEDIHEAHGIFDVSSCHSDSTV